MGSHPTSNATSITYHRKRRAEPEAVLPFRGAGEIQRIGKAAMRSALTSLRSIINVPEQSNQTTYLTKTGIRDITPRLKNALFNQTSNTFTVKAIGNGWVTGLQLMYHLTDDTSHLDATFVVGSAYQTRINTVQVIW
jgi:hypothetical protein